MSLSRIADVLDAHDREEQARRELITAHEIAVHTRDQLKIRRIEAEIAVHDCLHGTRLLNDLAA